MPKQGKTPKKKSKEKTPQKSGESEYPAMDEDEYNRLFQNAIEYAQAQLEQKHADHIKALEADREAKIKVVEDRLRSSSVVGGTLCQWAHNLARVCRSVM